MGGIYIHIPFCKQACSYCNFHFSTSLQRRPEFIESLHTEIELVADSWSDMQVDSIYLGGGTPSLCNADELNKIFDHFATVFKLYNVREITLEANPDDLSDSYLTALRSTPVNRLSIGIQSFHEDNLKFMNRAHNATEAVRSIEASLAKGFTTLTVDLIYGTPGLTDEQWIKNLEKVHSYPIQHLSCYALTVEERTALAHQIKTGKVNEPDSEVAARQFELLMDFAKNNSWDQYEISNFARQQNYAIHNTAYWFGKPYLGLGPSAHSFDGKNRSWNIANNAIYIKSLKEGVLPREKEVLTEKDRYNEWIMTRLRTKWGIDKRDLLIYPPEMQKRFEKELVQLIREDLVVESEGIITLTRHGKLWADQVASSLFFVEE